MLYHIRLEDPAREHFFREYRFMPSITFETLFRYLQQDLGLSPEYLMSFHLSDSEWERGLELTLIDVEGDATSPATDMRDVEVQRVLKKEGERLILVYDLLQDRELRMEITRVERTVQTPLVGAFERVDGQGGNPHVDFLEMNQGDLEGMLKEFKQSEE